MYFPLALTVAFALRSSSAVQVSSRTGAPTSSCSKVWWAKSHRNLPFPICKCKDDKAVFCGSSVVALKEFNIMDVLQHEVCKNSNSWTAPNAPTCRSLSTYHPALLKDQNLAIGKRVTSKWLDSKTKVGKVLGMIPAPYDITLSQDLAKKIHVRVELADTRETNEVNACAVGDSVVVGNRQDRIRSIGFSGTLVTLDSTSSYVLEAAANVFKEVSCSTISCAVRDRVQAYYAGDGKKYKARIASINDDDTITVSWDDGTEHHRTLSSWGVTKFHSCETGSVQLLPLDAVFLEGTKCKDIDYRGPFPDCENNPDEEDMFTAEKIGRGKGVCLDKQCYDKDGLGQWLSQSSTLPHNRAVFTLSDLNALFDAPFQSKDAL